MRERGRREEGRRKSETVRQEKVVSPSDSSGPHLIFHSIQSDDVVVGREGAHHIYLTLQGLEVRTSKHLDGTTLSTAL